MRYLEMPPLLLAFTSIGTSCARSVLIRLCSVLSG